MFPFTSGDELYECGNQLKGYVHPVFGCMVLFNGVMAAQIHTPKGKNFDY